jgi:lipid-binding SYLF domain-containing protein
MKILKFTLAILAIFTINSNIYAKSAQAIDIDVNKSLELFAKTVKGSNAFLAKSAKGYLVFPNVVKAGMGVGGEYGEGALRVDGKTVQYYSTASASIGFQFGIQTKAILIAFLTDKALNDFHKSNGWKVGVDGSIAIIKIGGGQDISNTTFNKPVIGFVYGNKGLMYNLTIEGSKFTKIVR